MESVSEGRRYQTRSYSSRWKQAWTPLHKTAVWHFNPSERDTVYTFFAPHSFDSSQLPVYLKVKPEIKDHRQLFSTKFAADHYVPLFALIELASDNNDPHELLAQYKYDDEILSKKLKDKDWRQSEKQLLNNASNNWKDNFSDSGKLPTIPVRDSNGGVHPFQLSKNWEGWLDVLPDLAFCDIQARHRGKPVRHLNIPLSSAILIKPRSEHETMLTARFKSKEQFFQDLIDTINKNNADPDSSQVDTSTRPYPWSLELYSDTKAKGYIKISKDPFLLYDTYISEKDWHVYMKSLESAGEPIRRFPTVAKMYPIADKLMSNVGNKDIVVQSFAYTTGEYKKLGLKLEDKPVEEMQRLRDEASKILSPELANLKKRVRETAELRMKKRQGGVVALNWAYAWQGGRSWLVNDLDVLKINNAAGKRPEELNQKAIMGNISATDIGNVLDWDRKRMRSGVYPAEWLHLSAFSWGGVAKVDDEDGYMTSQSFENLVFGTSECNSVMTRYEMAWQQLLRTERELTAYPDEISGTLSICCNDFSNPIVCDTKNNKGEYVIGMFKFTDTELKLLEGSDLKAKAAYDKLKGSTKESNLTAKEQMLVLAHDFPFIVYSIDYGLSINFTSRLFNMDRMQCWFSFFPFSRKFYHRSEAILDALIFETLREKANEELVHNPFAVLRDNELGKAKLA